MSINQLSINQRNNGVMHGDDNDDDNGDEDDDDDELTRVDTFWALQGLYRAIKTRLFLLYIVKHAREKKLRHTLFACQ